MLYGPRSLWPTQSISAGMTVRYCQRPGSGAVNPAVASCMARIARATFTSASSDRCGAVSGYVPACPAMKPSVSVPACSSRDT